MVATIALRRVPPSCFGMYFLVLNSEVICDYSDAKLLYNEKEHILSIF